MNKSELLDRVYKAGLPSNAKNIMFYLINRANTAGTCFPSVKTMAKDCGMSERTVQRMMKILVEKGVVVKKSRFRELGGQTSNLYYLQEVNIEEITEEEEVVEEEVLVEQEIKGSDTEKGEVCGEEFEQIDFGYYKDRDVVLSGGRKAENRFIIRNMYRILGEEYCGGVG